jgi:hypothetical protein
VPHFAQNAAAGGNSAPQDRQARDSGDSALATGAPQATQKAASCSSSSPHKAQLRESGKAITSGTP